MPEQKKFTDMTLVELEAYGYKCICTINYWTATLKNVENEMGKFKTTVTPPTEPVKEVIDEPTPESK